MKIGKWKNKPLKKELVDIIKIQEEEISRLNREKMKLNVVIRNEKPVRIDTQGLDYMVDLEQKYFVLQDIIKEAREYIESNGLTINENFMDSGVGDIFKNILKILDKGE